MPARSIVKSASYDLASKQSSPQTISQIKTGYETVWLPGTDYSVLRASPFGSPFGRSPPLRDDRPLLARNLSGTESLAIPRNISYIRVMTKGGCYGRRQQSNVSQRE